MANLRRGWPLPEVRDLLGHASIQMTERYAHLAPENVRRAVERIESLSRLGHASQIGMSKTPRNLLI
jgi:integrase